MMKKLLLLGTFLFSFTFSIKAQIAPTPTSVVVSDTLSYYWNKYYFITGAYWGYGTGTGQAAGQFTNSARYYPCPAITFTGYPFVGNRFENPGTIEITGLEGVFSKAPASNTGLLALNARLYLCALDANGRPKLPAIDSAEAKLSSKIAGVYGGTLTNGPKTITGNYAILARNVSTISGDSVCIYRTSCRTPTAYPASWHEKYSDGNGFIRHGSTFYSTTNFSLAAGFGYSTDYEFFLAPRVTYTLDLKEEWPAEVANSQTICTYDVLTFTNTSSSFVTHKMFNLLEFYKKWNQPGTPFINVPQGAGWTPDSSVTWKFDFEENGPTAGKIHLPYGGGSNTIQFYTDSAITPECSDQNFFRVNLKKMKAFGLGEQIGVQEMIPICVKNCTSVGLNKHSNNDHLLLYPNPSASGRAKLSGLKGNNTIAVYDVIGQLVYQEVSDNETVNIDLKNKASGTYLIKVTNNQNNKIYYSRLVKGLE